MNDHKMNPNGERTKRSRSEEEDDSEEEVDLSPEDKTAMDNFKKQDEPDKLSLDYAMKQRYAVVYWIEQLKSVEKLFPSGDYVNNKKSRCWWAAHLEEWRKLKIPYFTNELDPIMAVIENIIKLLDSKQSQCDASASARDEHSHLVQQIKQIDSLITEVEKVDRTNVNAVQEIMDKILTQTKNLTNAKNLEKKANDYLGSSSNNTFPQHYLLEGILADLENAKIIAEKDLVIAKKDLENAKLRADNAKKDLENDLVIAENALSRGMNETYRKTLVVQATLEKLAGFSQAEGSCSVGTRTYTDTSSKKPKSGKNDPTKGELISRKDTEDQLLLPGKYAGPVDQEWLENPGSFWDYANKESPYALVDLNDAYQEFIQSAVFLKRIDAKSKGSLTTEQYKMQMDETVASLTDDFFSEDKRNKPPGLFGNVARLVPQCQGKLSKKHFFPGPTSQEVQGAQVIINVLLDKLAQLAAKGAIIGNETEAHTDSPHRQKRCKKNATVEVIGGRKQRIGDFSIWHRGPHLWVLCDDAMELVFEIKPGQRVNSSVDAMRQESRDQLLSHLAKALIVALNFRGVGIDSHATGIIGSLAFVEILQMRLEGTGKKPKLTLWSTGPLPLMTEANFDEWYKSDERHTNSVDLFRKKLYGGKQKGLCCMGVPLGLYALWDIMQRPRLDLMGPNLKAYAAQDQIGTLIGNGTFSHVFESNDSDQVIKVSRFGRKKALDDEKEALEALQCGERDRGHDNLPSLKGDISLRLVIGGVDFQLPGIILSPRGQPVKYFMSGENGDQELAHRLKNIDAGLTSALNHIHAKGWVHNDISDNNIVVRNEKPVLIDFGAATKKNAVVEGFLGTCEYVHKEVHIFHAKRQTKAKYDWTALTYTLAVLANNCLIPPNVCPRRVIVDKDNVIFSKRLEWAKEKLRSCECANVLDGKLIEGWIRRLDGKKVTTCKCEKRKCGGGGCGCLKAGEGCNSLCECVNCENPYGKHPTKSDEGSAD